MLQVKDKGYGNNSVYYDEVFGLQIDSFTTEDNKGFVEKIVLDDGKEYIELNTVEELINVFQHIIKAYNLKQYSKGKKDILLVYTDNLKKAKGFLQKYITQTFTFYIQILDFIEIRSIECWNPNAHTATDIQRHAQWIFDNVFNVDEYVYLTGNQIVRRR